jgi:hypothetical protein
MTLQALKIGGREFILLPKRDFQKLAAQAERQMEDDYWTQVALAAEASAKSKKEKPIPFDEVEREFVQQHNRADVRELRGKGLLDRSYDYRAARRKK